MLRAAVLHVAFEAVQVIEHLLFLLRELLSFPAILAWHWTGLRAVTVCLLQLVDEFTLVLRQLVSAASKIAHLLAGLLLAHSAYRVARFLQTIGCASRFR